MSTLYVDADLILHRVLPANLIEWDPQNVMLNQTGARRDFASVLTRWAENAPWHNRLVVVISDTSNFRKALSSSYKAGRKAKDGGYGELRQWAIESYDTLVLPGIEADDAIGIKLTEDPASTGCSIDKDMATLPGRHWNPQTKKLKVVSEAEADLNWLRQALTGDPVDGYTGIKGIGPAKAAKLLARQEPVDVLWGRYLRAYADHGLSGDDAVLNARLARILRSGEYDPETAEVRWTAPTAVAPEPGPPVAEARDGHQYGRRPVG